MPIAARFHDGMTAAAQDVGLDYERLGTRGTLIIRPQTGQGELAR